MVALGMSLPTWERGLKQYENEMKLWNNQVAPHVGAWIETFVRLGGLHIPRVAPHVGAWIETHQTGKQ